jgi:hypothetical protein
VSPQSSPERAGGAKKRTKTNKKSKPQQARPSRVQRRRALIAEVEEAQEFRNRAIAYLSMYDTTDSAWRYV